MALDENTKRFLDGLHNKENKEPPTLEDIFEHLSEVITEAEISILTIADALCVKGILTSDELWEAEERMRAKLDKARKERDEFIKKLKEGI